jgi:hypothetical protein
VSPARAAASRKNGARSRGPKTPEGKARSAQNALKHGMRALTFVVLPDESAVEFAALEAALVAELAPEGALQLVLARRVASAAWRLARADRMEVELFEQRRWDNAGLGVALIRDGNGTRSFETLLRYRNAAIAELMRALRTLKALQAEQAADTGDALAHPIPQGRRAHLPRPNEPERPAAPDLDYLPGAPPEFAARPPLAQRPQPNEPERGALSRPGYLPGLAPGRTLHEDAAPWLPNEPESGGAPTVTGEHGRAAAARTRPPA